MTQWNVQHRKCDRCGHSAGYRDDGVTDFSAWGIIQCRPVNGPITERIGFGDHPREHMDLCRNCLQQFLTWWSRPPSPITANAESRIDQAGGGHHG